jgi:CheY-like chemotaxis protein
LAGFGNDLVSTKEVSRLLAFVEDERRYFQDILAMLPVVVAVVSADRKIVSANRAFRKRLGMPSYETPRSELGDFLPGEVLKSRLEEVVSSGKPQENIALAMSGPPARSFRLSILPLPESEDHGRRNALIVLEDLTPEPPAPAAAGGLETVLIVDSDAGIRALMGSALACQGYVVIEATGAEEAERLCGERAEPVHIVVSDSKSIEKLRRHRPALRAVYVAPAGDEDNREVGSLPPNTLYLKQPFTLNSLLTSVRTLLNGV